MKKVIVSLLVLSMLLMVACGNSNNSETNTGENANSTEEETDNEPEEEVTEVAGDTEGTDTAEVAGGPVANPASDRQTIADFVSGLTDDVYEGLDMTVAVMERMAILPGAVFRVNILITNNGDKTIAYSQGSSTNEIPSALFLTSETLQPILPADRLGMATMDMQVLELAPGESINFNWFVLAVQPDSDFDDATSALFMEDGTYIGDLSWDEIYSLVPGLVPVEPGSYEVEVAFRFHVLADGEAVLFAEDTAYIATSLPVTIQ